MDTIILGLFSILVIGTAVVFTSIYMKDKVMIHNGVEGQIDGYGKIFVTMLIPAGFIWTLVFWLFSGVIHFIAANLKYVFLLIAAYFTYSLITHKDEDKGGDE